MTLRRASPLTRRLPGWVLVAALAWAAQAVIPAGGASPAGLAATPAAAAAADTRRRERFIAAADQDIARGKAAVVRLQKRAAIAGAKTKDKLDLEIGHLRLDVFSAEDKLSSLKHAGIDRWREFEAGVNAATARLRRSTDQASA